MPVYRAIPLCVAMLLTLGGTGALAGDDNPWRMEVPGERRSYGSTGDHVGEPETPQWGPTGSRRDRSHPLYDLNRDGLQRREVAPQQALPSGRQPAPVAGPAANDGYRIERRGEDYGYAGSDRAAGGTGRREQFGAFPPIEGQGAGNNGGSTVGIEFGGRQYGAFPPLDRKPATQDRRQGWNETGIATGREDRQGNEFANVPPPPVTESPPDTAYPYPGYGMRPGTGTGLYGLPYDPLTLGIFGPGLLW